MSSREMITLLIDIVSKGGNLLLDVGPMHDGSLSHIQENRLNDLADWMDINSEGNELTLEFHSAKILFATAYFGRKRYFLARNLIGLFLPIILFEVSCQFVSSNSWKSSIFT